MTNPFTAFAFKASPTLKILPLGDSITLGNTFPNSYRGPLYNLLSYSPSAGDDFAVSFVGPLVSGNFPSPNHAGFTGMTTNGIWGEVEFGLLIEIYQPDVILLIVGTNDMLAHSAPSSVFPTYTSLLAQIASDGPTVKCICGSIPPIDPAVDATAAGLVPTFNAGLPAIVASAGANFSFVDLNATLTLADLFDGIHPNATGYNIIANDWFAPVLTVAASISGGYGSQVARTMPARISDVTNVKDFGATGAGFPTDDWAAIMAAYNHGQVSLVTTSSGSGNRLFFSGGVPAGVVAGMYVKDGTTPGNLPTAPAPRVNSTTSTTVDLNTSTTSVGSGETITFNIPSKGTIFFPPGTYYISQPLFFGDTEFTVDSIWSGVLGASTITGNFADYIFNRNSESNTQSGASGCHVIERLNFVNTNATGGGIRLGMCVGGAIRDCTVTAYLGINTGNTNNLASLEITIKNCQLIGPGSNVSGSIGLMLLADGPTISCYVNGFETGAIVWGNEGGQMLYGCRFELCGIGYHPGVNAPGSPPAQVGGAVLMGCSFKNCSEAIKEAQGGDRYFGIHIEGTNGTLPSGANPQYGIHVPQSEQDGNLFEGVVVTGQYDQFGIYIAGEELSPAQRANMVGVSSTNTGSGSAWGSGVSPVANMSHAPFTSLVACNVAPVTQVVNKIIFSSPISSITWSGGVATLTWSSGNLSPLAGQSFTTVVSGASVSGYDGSFTGTILGTTLTYPVSGPLSNAGATGTVAVNIWNNSEGDCFNVNDADTSTWGADVFGGSSTHAKVRYNGAALTVVGI